MQRPAQDCAEQGILGAAVMCGVKKKCACVFVCIHKEVKLHQNDLWSLSRAWAYVVFPLDFCISRC